MLTALYSAFLCRYLVHRKACKLITEYMRVDSAVRLCVIPGLSALTIIVCTLQNNIYNINNNNEHHFFFF